MRRAICFESNEGTVATECKVDFLEIVDSSDESIIVSSDDRETTSSDESEIEDGREDSEQVCPNVFRLKAELSFLNRKYRGKITPRSVFSFSLASRKFWLISTLLFQELDFYL